MQRQLEQLTSRATRRICECESQTGLGVETDLIDSSRIDTFRKEFIQKYVGVDSEPRMTAVKARTARVGSRFSIR